MLSNEASVHADLGNQYKALRERVAASDLYEHEPAEFLTAWRALSAVASRLRITADLGSVTTSESRNVVRKVLLDDDSIGVLKVCGHTRELGEADTLARWRAAGLPCVEVLGSGYQSVAAGGRESVATYVMTRYVGDLPLVHPGTIGARVECVEALVRFIRPFHLTTPTPWRRSWRDRLAPHLRWTLPPLREAGFELPARWQEKLVWLSQLGDSLVHGDPAGRNILLSDAGAMTLLDPVGSLRGLPEADVGRICFQVGSDDAYGPAIDAACAVDRSLHPGFVACLTGLNFLASAGYFVAGHVNPDTDLVARGGEAGALERSANWVGIATTLIDGLPLEKDWLAIRAWK